MEDYKWRIYSTLIPNEQAKEDRDDKLPWQNIRNQIKKATHLGNTWKAIINNFISVTYNSPGACDAREELNILNECQNNANPGINPK